MSFWEKSELSRTRVIWLNLLIENPLNISRPRKFIFENLHSFFLATRSWQKTIISTFEPYIGAMTDTMHEPQANLWADQKFSSVDVFKWKRGDKPRDLDRLIKRQTTPLLSLQNGQVNKSNRTNTLREFQGRFAKDRIRLQELSPFSKGQSIYVFQKIKSKSKS